MSGSSPPNVPGRPSDRPSEPGALSSGRFYGTTLCRTSHINPKALRALSLEGEASHSGKPPVAKGADKRPAGKTWGRGRPQAPSQVPTTCPAPFTWPPRPRRLMLPRFSMHLNGTGADFSETCLGLPVHVRHTGDGVCSTPHRRPHLVRTGQCRKAPPPREGPARPRLPARIPLGDHVPRASHGISVVSSPLICVVILTEAGTIIVTDFPSQF